MAKAVKGLAGRGWATQLAQVEAVSEELDSYIEELSSLVDHLTVRQRVMSKAITLD